MLLEVPALPCVVEEGVFDAWAWCESDVLEWRRPRDTLAVAGEINGANPPGLAFVMREECTFLPRELARLHVPEYGLGDELALAPYAIDDATDLLFEHRKRPRELFWLAATSLDALVWGLHDWVHFHNHGPFDDPPTTELQCDLIALAWLRLNQGRIGIEEHDVERVSSDLARLSRARFDEATRTCPLDIERLFAGPYPVGLRTARVNIA